MDKEIVWMDLDGVLANIDKPILDLYNQENGTHFQEGDIKHWSFQDIFPSQDAFYAFFRAHAHNIYGNALPYAPFPGEAMDSRGFLSMVEQLVGKHSATHCMVMFSSFVHPTDTILKMDFLRRHFTAKHAENLLCGNSKARLFQKGNLIIDDSPKNLIRARDIGAIPICIKRPWNAPDSNPAWDGPRYTFEEALRKLEEELG